MKSQYFRILFLLYLGFTVFSSDSCEFGQVLKNGICQCPKLGQTFNDTSNSCECDDLTMTEDSDGNCTCRYSDMQLNSNGVCTCLAPGKFFDSNSSCVCEKNTMNLINNSCQCKTLGQIINSSTNLCGCNNSTMIQLNDSTCQCKELGKRIDPLSQSCSCNNLTMSLLNNGTCKCNEFLKEVSSNTNECTCINNLILSDEGKCTCPMGFGFYQSSNTCIKGIFPWIFTTGDPSIIFDYINQEVKSNSNFMIKASINKPDIKGKVVFNWTMTVKNSSNLTNEQLLYFKNSYDKNALIINPSLLLNVISINFTLSITNSVYGQFSSSIEIPFTTNLVDLIIKPGQNIELKYKPKKILATALINGSTFISMNSVLQNISIFSSPASNSSSPFTLDSANTSLSEKVFKSLTQNEYFYLDPNDLDYNKNYLLSIVVSYNKISKLKQIFVELSNPEILINFKDLKAYYSNEKSITIDATNSIDPVKKDAIFQCTWKNLCNHNHSGIITLNNCILEGSFQEFNGVVRHNFIIDISSNSGSFSLKHLSFYTVSNLSILNRMGNISFNSDNQSIQGILQHNFNSLKGAHFKWNLTKMIDYTTLVESVGTTDFFLQKFSQPNNSSFNWTNYVNESPSILMSNIFKSNSYEYGITIPKSLLLPQTLYTFSLNITMPDNSTYIAQNDYITPIIPNNLEYTILPSNGISFQDIFQIINMEYYGNIDIDYFVITRQDHHYSSKEIQLSPFLSDFDEFNFILSPSQSETNITKICLKAYTNGLYIPYCIDIQYNNLSLNFSETILLKSNIESMKIKVTKESYLGFLNSLPTSLSSGNSSKDQEYLNSLIEQINAFNTSNNDLILFATKALSNIIKENDESLISLNIITSLLNFINCSIDLLDSRYKDYFPLLDLVNTMNYILRLIKNLFGFNSAIMKNASQINNKLAKRINSEVDLNESTISYLDFVTVINKKVRIDMISLNDTLDLKSNPISFINNSLTISLSNISQYLPNCTNIICYLTSSVNVWDSNTISSIQNNTKIGNNSNGFYYPNSKIDLSNLNTINNQFFYNNSNISNALSDSIYELSYSILTIDQNGITSSYPISLPSSVNYTYFLSSPIKADSIIIPVIFSSSTNTWSNERIKILEVKNNISIIFQIANTTTNNSRLLASQDINPIFISIFRIDGAQNYIPTINYYQLMPFWISILIICLGIIFMVGTCFSEKYERLFFALEALLMNGKTDKDIIIEYQKKIHPRLSLKYISNDSPVNSEGLEMEESQNKQLINLNEDEASTFEKITKKINKKKKISNKIENLILRTPELIMNGVILNEKFRWECFKSLGWFLINDNEYLSPFISVFLRVPHWMRFLILIGHLHALILLSVICFFNILFSSITISPYIIIPLISVIINWIITFIGKKLIYGNRYYLDSPKKEEGTGACGKIIRLIGMILMIGKIIFSVVYIYIYSRVDLSVFTDTMTHYWLIFAGLSFLFDLIIFQIITSLIKKLLISCCLSQKRGGYLSCILNYLISI